MNILLTSVGCVGYVGLIKAFKEAGCKVFGVDCDKDAVGFNFCDGFSLVPHGDSDDYIDKILEACSAHEIDLIIPSSDNEILRIGEYRETLQTIGAKVILPSNRSLDICHDKSVFYEFLSKWDIVHPKVRDLLGIEFPAIRKPKIGKGSIGVSKITEANDWCPSNLGTGELVQDFISGDEYTVDILANENSTILSIVQRKRILVDSGISVQAEVVEDDEGKLVCSELNNRLEMIGMYCVQYIKNDTGIYVLEVNPRFGGGSILSLKADPTIINNYLNIAQNKPIQSSCRPEMIKMKRYYAEIYE